MAFVAPATTGWLLPLYEAALLTANTNFGVEVSLVTPEARPLEQFGREASDAVAQALRDAGVALRDDGARTPTAIVTVPLLRGPRIPACPPRASTA